MKTNVNAGQVYSTTTKTFHWLMALLLGSQWVVAWFMPHVGRHTVPDGLVGLHVSLGVLILVALVGRIGWRILHRPVSVATPTRADLIAGAMFALLYLLMAVVPVLGWANANARGWTVGVTQMFAPGGDQADFRLPAIMAKGSELGHQMGDIHGLLAWALLILVGLHVASGLYHHWVLKDGTLQRMR
jgi:cytochrome b561